VPHLILNLYARFGIVLAPFTYSLSVIYTCN